MRLSLLSISVLACFLTLFGRFAAANDEQIAFFEKKIRPVLAEHCYKCHSADAEKKRGGLLLDSKEAIRTGGESGPGIVPGQPDESLVLGALQYDSFEMPPSGKLDDHVIADFERWIRLGAHDPRSRSTVEESSESMDVEAGKQFWSFQPITGVPTPSVADFEWPDSAVDLFLQARLEAEGITHVPDADRYTLVRRVYYDLIGLPPTPQQIRDFVNDQSSTAEAMAKLVDRLLESKHFGERWGRHWLDVVRFAESSGGGRTLLFPDAWRYRDYVIDAFNDDMPFDQFLREQIAGDLMPAADRLTRWRQLTGVGFLMLGPTNYELQDKDILEMDIVDEQLDTIGKAFMGMTVGCARCHDHKFDPIPMRDYYAMAGILKSTNCVIHSNVSAWNRVDLPVDDELESKLEEHQAKLDSAQQELKTAQKQLQDAKSKLGTPVDQLAGIVVDDAAARKEGKWVPSTHVRPFVAQGYVHDAGVRNATCTVSFPAKLPDSRYEVRVYYTAGENRSTRVPVVVRHADGESKHFIDQTEATKLPSFVSLGEFQFSADEREEQSVTLSNVGAAAGVVIADAVQFLPVTKLGKSDLAAKIPEPNEIATKSDSTTELKSVEKTNQAGNGADANLTLLESRIQKLQSRVKKLKAGGPKRPKAMAPNDKPETGDIHLAIRGVVANQGPLIPRGVLQVALNRAQPDIGENESGRLQLADWVVDRTNPLTARVAVNRVWHWLFGVGLVRTVDNFGQMGERPSHPELLNFLANAFMEDGWSMKRLIRRLMLSHTYRLSSQANAAGSRLGLEKDPSNRLMWRMSRRRLDAESIRDSILSVAGTLDLKMGGSNIKTGTAIEYDYVFDSRRRSVYLPVFRNTLPQLFATFDFADPNIQGGRRTASTIAPQALLLMNAPFIIEQTRLASKSLMQEEGIDDGNASQLDQRIDRSYLQVVGRLPSDGERRLAARFVADDRDGDRYALLYQTLFQSLKFRYVD